MNSSDLARHRIATILLAVALLAPVVASGVLTYGPRAGGPPDAGGDLPKQSAPGPLPASGFKVSEIATPTTGVVMDVQTRDPISGALVVVTNALGEIVGSDLTDENGGFLIYLFDVPDLELSIPAEGVHGLEIQAGEAVLILVP